VRSAISSFKGLIDVTRRRIRSRYNHWATKLPADDMGRRNFNGQVQTIGDSCEADYLVIVACQRCNADSQMHPYTLISAKKDLIDAKLGVVLPGFRCRRCRNSVYAVVTCTYRYPGEM
jgi:hypothetical protein